MEANEINPLLAEFETQVCSRCGGGGQYSYCQMYGSTCFKCHGAGKVYTKRGMAAREYMRSLYTVPVTEAKVGMLMWVDPGPFNRGGWMAILEIKPTMSQRGAHGPDGRLLYDENGKTVWEDYPLIDVKTKALTYGADATATVKVIENKAALKAFKAQALQYQAGLNKKGEVAKARTSAKAASCLIASI